MGWDEASHGCLDIDRDKRERERDTHRKDVPSWPGFLGLSNHENGFASRSTSVQRGGE